GVEHHPYPGLKTPSSMLIVQIVPIKSENNEMSPSSFEYVCKNSKIKVIYLMPDYHNPTASLMSVENRNTMSCIANKSNQI
ncbi:UNVERIFIED_CONTAM: PLP-dependent aminotransferase family protein, partial [Bacillus amyloliquefaciens DSM 7 = ATCC 23350]